ncbi:hypothetical protein B9T31_15950 [Acinetobacter sp. ANC 4558]|uniref:hypothetical protein n=1 Tax=Acinetobacter sp. ANC 4558 TaxID=1977876 RepID=UPI000A3535FD|nr:hypothetical protein [Acinetobacter sp. ANC 4558]OTG80793.1 hypothetical protein B9T31_15950 [Acinetobacter sp. ANC 4558]
MTKDIDPNKASSDARADRLNSWVTIHYRNQQEFIEKFGLNQGEISNIIKKKRVIGERKARKLESQTDIPKMYLDGIDSTVKQQSEAPVDSQAITCSKYDKLIQICKTIDTLENDKKLSSQDLQMISFVINHAETALDDLLEKYLRPSTKKSAS